MESRRKEPPRTKEDSVKVKELITEASTADNEDVQRTITEEIIAEEIITEEDNEEMVNEEYNLAEFHVPTATKHLEAACLAHNSKVKLSQDSTRSEDTTLGNACIHNTNQYSNATMDDMADEEQAPQDKELSCSCGQCSSEDEDNAKIKKFEEEAKKLRNTNSDLEEKLKSLQNQMTDLVRMYPNHQGDPPQKGSRRHHPWKY